MDETPITSWLAQLKAGNMKAVQPLWERYYGDLVSVARRYLPHAGDLDSHLIAASAFDSFYLAAAAGRFPKLDDRSQLWRLLITITERKAYDAIEKHNTQRRGGNRKNLGAKALNPIVSPEPTPEFVLMMVEELEKLLNLLDDDKLRNIAVWKMEGHTNQEIADRLNCALRTVASKLDVIRAIFSRRERAGRSN